MGENRIPRLGWTYIAKTETWIYSRFIWDIPILMDYRRRWRTKQNAHWFMISGNPCEALIKRNSVFKFMSGMRVWRYNPVTGDKIYYRIVLAGDAYEDTDGTTEWINVSDGRDYYPDLDDPATNGCLDYLDKEYEKKTILKECSYGL